VPQVAEEGDLGHVVEELEVEAQMTVTNGSSGRSCLGTAEADRVELLGGHRRDAAAPAAPNAPVRTVLILCWVGFLALFRGFSQIMLAFSLTRPAALAGPRSPTCPVGGGGSP
jgi:hypothetical protein